MSFISFDFAIFLPVVFIGYWLLQRFNLRWQNLLIVASSYLFYGWWDFRFLLLVIASTTLDYFVGIGLEKVATQSRRKLLLAISIVINLVILGFFKYLNFFVDSFAEAFHFFGMQFNVDSLNIVLPVGISFYTFQTMSYAIDVYKRQMKPTRDFISFAAFVSFFPQLVAGPIERATNLLPQFYAKRKFEYHPAVDGLRQILWGVFKKVVIADNCAQFANIIFNNSDAYGGSTLFLGAIFFAFQIYCDFSGYSDIAIGTARLFGISLMQNFNFPYFSRDIGEFWRRWHISLSTWFRDYVYIPLGGGRGSQWFRIRNVVIVFVLSGLWHGANWTYVVWGALNALYFLLYNLLGRKDTQIKVSRFLPVWNFGSIALTFALTLFAWIFFRAESIGQASDIISEIFSSTIFSIPDFPRRAESVQVITLIVFFVLIEWWGRKNKYAIESVGSGWPSAVRFVLYYGLILIIFLFWGEEQQFIYFQF